MRKDADKVYPKTCHIHYAIGIKNILWLYSGLSLLWRCNCIKTYYLKLVVVVVDVDNACGYRFILARSTGGTGWKGISFQLSSQFGTFSGSRRPHFGYLDDTNLECLTQKWEVVYEVVMLASWVTVRGFFYYSSNNVNIGVGQVQSPFFTTLFVGQQ